MAQEIRTAKTETIGPIAIERLAKLDAWKTYKTAFDKFSEIKGQAHQAKKKMREVLKAKLVDERRLRRATT